MSLNHVLPDTLTLKVLVVEDHQDFAQLIANILELHGCTVSICYNAQAGLQAARENRPDVIFSDLALPGNMSGLDLARQIRADKELAHIPLVAITGYVRESDRASALEAGFDMVFPKPFKFNDLTSALRTFGSNGSRVAHHSSEPATTRNIREY